MIPSSHPTLESLVKCRVATLTQSTPRNTQERLQKQPRRAAQKQHGITHRLIRCLSLNGVGSTDEQSRQQSQRLPVEPMQRLQRASVEPVIEHRINRQNQAKMISAPQHPMHLKWRVLVPHSSERLSALRIPTP